MGVQANVTVTSNIFEVLEDANQRLMRGEDMAAEQLLALSIPVTPLSDGGGTLRGSGAVQNAHDPETGSAVTFDTPYAARLHEHPEYNFTEPGTGGKYLENTALQNKGELGEIIATEVRRG